MKLGVLTNVVGEMPLAEALAYFKRLGVQMVEIGCGGYPGKQHCDPEVLLGDKGALDRFVETVKNSGMEISALSCHGNPASIRSTDFLAVPATVRIPCIRTGWSVHGRRTTQKFWSINGMRF